MSLIFHDEFNPRPVLQFAALAYTLEKAWFLHDQTDYVDAPSRSVSQDRAPLLALGDSRNGTSRGISGEALNWEITNYDER
jgi:hypothetical protein